MLPLADGYLSAIVFSTKQADELLKLSDAGFCEELTRISEEYLGQVRAVTQRHSFPLVQQQVFKYVGPNVALLGDAAHTIHPLAGQGVNLGMYDAGVLCQVIAEALERGRNFAARPVLRRYERWRRGHNQMVHAAMNGFFWLFGSDMPGIRRLRNAGLAATNNLDPLKRLIMRHASGLTGDLPELARVVRESY